MSDGHFHTGAYRGETRLEPCPTPGCPGDSRYAAPGRGHLGECRYPMNLAHEPSGL